MTNKMRLAIDLLWVKHNRIGGVESYIRNVLEGLIDLKEEFEIVLLVAKDNAYSFIEYTKDPRISMFECNINSMNVPRRILWQNVNLGRTLRRLSINTCFEPHNYIPLFGVDKINFIVTIHDLQLMHYPENFSKKKRMWFKFNWKNTLKKAKFVVAISNSVKDDINRYYPGFGDKIRVIYNPIIVDYDECLSVEDVFKLYGVERNGYYYTVSSLHPHKNIDTLLRVFKEIRSKENNILPTKLLVSGIGGPGEDDFKLKIKQYGLEGSVALTGFVDNATRNALYKYCRAFLFPSIFEGFGMPPIEASLFGATVITTSESCLPEVTEGKCNYVVNPFDQEEWIRVMNNNNGPVKEFDYERYSLPVIASCYFNLFMEALL